MFLFFLPENKSKRELIRMLVQKGFESDPVAAWSKAQEKVLSCCKTSAHTCSQQEGKPAGTLILCSSAVSVHPN